MEGQSFGGGNPRTTVPAGIQTVTNNYQTADEGHGAIRAIDPLTGEKRWDFTMADVTDARHPHHRVGSALQRRDVKATSSRSTPAAARSSGRRPSAESWRRAR